jgi:hypothetical protein
VESAKKQKILRRVGYTALFIFSFVFFFYYTFPYNSLKEAIAVKANQFLGWQVKIGELGPSFPLGVEASDIRIQPSASSAEFIELESLEVNLSVLNFLIGKVAVFAELVSKNGGEFDVYPKHGLFDLLDQNVIPSSVGIESEKFDVGQLLTFFLASQGTGNDVNPMVGPLLATIAVRGNLNGNAEFSIDSDDLSKTSGEMSLNFQDTLLELSRSSLGVDDQKFRKAILRAKVTQGKVQIDKSSGFESQELNLGIDGSIALNKQPLRSSFNMTISVKLEEKLKEQMGTILDIAGGRDGALNLQLGGELGNPSILPM